MAVNIDELTVGERLELISRLWDSIPDSLEDMPVPEWHRRELERRLADANARPDETIPWEDVKEELRLHPDSCCRND